MLDDSDRWQLLEGGRVAVLGAGLMGHAIAAIFVNAGYDVTCVEPDASTRESLAKRVDDVIAQLPAGATTTRTISAVSDPSELDPATLLVVEAAPEQLALKQELLSRIAKICPDAVLATNTSVYRVGDVGALVDDRSRVIGTHWWNPPHLIPLVEVIQGSETNPAIVTGMTALLRSLGKTPVHVQKDTPGFIGNRLQHALWREAMALIQEGICDATAVDVVVRNSIGLRLSEVGPIENADYVGLDLTRSIHEYVFPSLSTAQKPLPILEEAVAAGHLGAKTGRGLLEWPEGAREATGRRLAARVKLLTSLIGTDHASTQ
ncbi:MAG TPA: 3-hydroxyacyl-CoA dehydrogenase NAD-binding domain-containing protein [Acidimicrobiales bacterium]|nr:3-hydroxyacyl-CoA dehydrogenase NAD-binding domain-containing protein [Acidimicrobiales bacterium]